MAFKGFVELYGKKVEYSRLYSFGCVVDGNYESFSPSALGKRAQACSREELIDYCHGLLEDHNIVLNEMQQRAVDRTRYFTREVLKALQGK